MIDLFDVETVFQPVVDLTTERTVGFEALSRWTKYGMSSERAFTDAAAAGAVDDLDRHCVKASLTTALTSPLPRRSILLINVEPSTEVETLLNEDWLIEGAERFRLMFELTERGLLTRPASIMKKLSMLRDAGIGIALDDVGGDLAVLAWFDVIGPDVIKLDLSLIQRRPSPDQARILNAVYAHHERSGAVIVAEGIETAAHLDQARALGATLGQGYRFGAPASAHLLRAGFGEIRRDFTRQRTAPADESRSPFQQVARRKPVRAANRTLLSTLSRDIQVHAERADDRLIVLAVGRNIRQLPNGAGSRFGRIAQSGAFVAVFGYGLPVERTGGVVRIDLDVEDPLCSDWTLIVFGTHTAYALIARERTSDELAPGMGGSDIFDFVRTTDRSLVASVVANLLSRIESTQDADLGVAKSGNNFDSRNPS